MRARTVIGNVTLMLVAAVFTAYGGITAAQTPSDQGKRAPAVGAGTAGTPATAQGTSATGIAECDDYVQRVTRCINTKVPEKDRPHERERLSTQMTMELPMFGAKAGPVCQLHMRRQMENDRYGCYDADVAKAGVQTACTLFTRAELERLLGKKLGEGVHDGTKCTYPYTGDQFAHPFRIAIGQSGGRDEIDAVRAVPGILNKQLAHDSELLTKDIKSGKLRPAASRTVPGIGDDAVFTFFGEGMLTARRGDAYVQLESGDYDALIAIAKQTLERMKK